MPAPGAARLLALYIQADELRTLGWRTPKCRRWQAETLDCLRRTLGFHPVVVQFQGLRFRAGPVTGTMDELTDIPEAQHDRRFHADLADARRLLRAALSNLGVTADALAAADLQTPPAVSHAPPLAGPSAAHEAAGGPASAGPVEAKTTGMVGAQAPHPLPPPEPAGMVPPPAARPTPAAGARPTWGLTGLTVELPVAHLDAAAAWYERLLGAPPRAGQGGAGLAEFSVMDGSLRLWEDASAPHGGARLHLGVADLTAARDRLLLLGIHPGPIETAPAGVLGCTFLDPDGNRLALFEQAPAVDDRGG